VKNLNVVKYTTYWSIMYDLLLEFHWKNHLVIWSNFPNTNMATLYTNFCLKIGKNCGYINSYNFHKQPKILILKWIFIKQDLSMFILYFRKLSCNTFQCLKGKFNEQIHSRIFAYGRKSCKQNISFCLKQNNFFSFFV
jgi:hypothetical protein